MALTRAKRHLVLTHSRERFRYGKVERSVPSDFLYRLPEDLTDAGDDYEFIKQMSVNDINAEFAKIFEGQCLHARSIGFVHPRSGEYMYFESELPEYFVNLKQTLEKRN